MDALDGCLNQPERCLRGRFRCDDEDDRDQAGDLETITLWLSRHGRSPGWCTSFETTTTSRFRRICTAFLRPGSLDPWLIDARLPLWRSTKRTMRRTTLDRSVAGYVDSIDQT